MTNGDPSPSPARSMPPTPRALRPLHTGRLLLTPRRAEAVCDPATLVPVLTAGGLLGAPRPGIDLAFAPGDQFAHLIAFSGCAVHLPLADDGGGPVLYLRLAGPWPAPMLQFGRNSRPPRCPACGKPLADWRNQLPADPAPVAAPLLRCAGCGAIAPAWDWHWRGQAGCGRVFVICEEVFPGEGQPLPRLFTLLEGLGIGPWVHFYQQDD